MLCADFRIVSMDRDIGRYENKRHFTLRAFYGKIHGTYRRRRRRARASLGHGVLVIHEAVKKRVVRMKPRSLRRASQSAQRAQSCQASPATLRKLERSVRRNVLRCLCNPSEALPTFQIASGQLSQNTVHPSRAHSTFKSLRRIS